VSRVFVILTKMANKKRRREDEQDSDYDEDELISDFDDDDNDNDGNDGNDNDDEVGDFDPAEYAAVAQLLATQDGLNSNNNKPQRRKIDNRAGVVSKLSEFALDRSWPWVETLSLTCNQPLQLDNTHDDLKRETAFYTRTVAGVSQALSQFASLHIPFKRPDDFFAEMAKPDQHMAKVKASLLTEKRKMAAVEVRKKNDGMKKFAKQVQTEKLQAKQKAKKENMQQASKARNSMKHNELKVERSRVPMIDDALQQSVGDKQAKRDKKRQKREERQQTSQKQKGRKREAKDSKFGYGGRKWDKKKNSSDSSKNPSTLRFFNDKKNRQLPDQFSHQKPNKKGGASKGSSSTKSSSTKRPGKRQRKASFK